MKSHLLLLRMVLDDLGTRCCTSTIRDFKRITERVEHEGLSFLTITLPDFCKDFEKSLDKGEVDPSSFAGYAKLGYLPYLFKGFTSRVFDTYSGKLLHAPDIDAIYSVRQACLLFKKIELPCSDARVANAYEKYMQCEQDVRENDRLRTLSQYEEFARAAIVVWGDVLTEMDRKVYLGDLVPKHGPGSTADGLLGNKKYNQTVWTERLEEYFPHGEFLFTSWSHFCDSPGVDILEPGSEIPVKVITVPKTLKTPRIIAIEPTCMQYAQQALLQPLVEAMEHHTIPVTRGVRLRTGLVGFTDQEPNRYLAREGSLNGDLATLDLSEASDRVSNQLVLEMLKIAPHFSSAVQSCRSRKADVPGKGVIRLAKFASMGSGLCFPIEAMVFSTIVYIGIARSLNLSLSREIIEDFSGRVRIYGDDLVVPVEHVHSVISALQDFGLVVNADKSFWTGKFRESCGKDFYDGFDVSVVKVTRELPSLRKHVLEIVSAVSLRNRMYFSGNWKTAAFLDDLIGKLIPFPLVGENSPALGRHSYLPPEGERECRYLQKPLVKAATVKVVTPQDLLEDHGALLKVFLNKGEPIADPKHLERAGRASFVSITTGWVSVV